MAYETLVAVYDTAAHADAAVKALKAAGFHESDISVFDDERLMAGKKTLSAGVKEAGLWHRLFGTDVYQHEANIYGQTVEDGGVVISVRVPDSEVAHATAVLDIHRPVDVHDRAVTLGVAPAAHVETIQEKIEAVPLAAVQTVAVSPKLAAAQPDVLRLAEEQLQVGKEMAETGRTRVRRFVTEKDVAADVTLHEEHAEVIRNAISDPKFVGDIDWADEEIEVVETAEHAVAKKTAKIVEEVALRKVGTRTTWRRSTTRSAASRSRSSALAPTARSSRARPPNCSDERWTEIEPPDIRRRVRGPKRPPALTSLGTDKTFASRVTFHANSYLFRSPALAFETGIRHGERQTNTGRKRHVNIRHTHRRYGAAVRARRERGSTGPRGPHVDHGFAGRH